MKVLLSVIKDGKKYWADSKETKQVHLYFAYPKNSYSSIRRVPKNQSCCGTPLEQYPQS